MAILRLKPTCKDYLWGGEILREKYHIQSDLNPLAEAWVFSCHPDGPSTIINGAFSGKTLNEFFAEHPEALGELGQKFEFFPLLIKLIDAKDDLSIQVHPSDDYALKNEGQYGKTEMWYVLSHEPGAFLYYGFEQMISPEEFRKRIEDRTLTEVLHKVLVEDGDVFFIPSGTVHAIGKGIQVAEIQQNSNLTYRIYDYGRVGADGKPRDLHIEKAIRVAQLSQAETPLFQGHIGQCEYFTTDRMDGSFSGICGEESFLSILIVTGDGSIDCDGEHMEIKIGDSIFLPANSGGYSVTGTGLKCLITYLK